MVQAGRGRGKINKQGLEVRLLDHNGEGAAPGPSVPSLERPDEGPAGDMVPLEVARSRLESQRVSGGPPGLLGGQGGVRSRPRPERAVDLNQRARQPRLSRRSCALVWLSIADCPVLSTRTDG